MATSCKGTGTKTQAITFSASLRVTLPALPGGGTLLSLHAGSLRDGAGRAARLCTGSGSEPVGACKCVSAVHCHTAPKMLSGVSIPHAARPLPAPLRCRADGHPGAAAPASCGSPLRAASRRSQREQGVTRRPRRRRACLRRCGYEGGGAERSGARRAGGRAGEARPRGGSRRRARGLRPAPGGCASPAGAAATVRSAAAGSATCWQCGAAGAVRCFRGGGPARCLHRPLGPSGALGCCWEGRGGEGCVAEL